MLNNSFVDSLQDLKEETKEEAEQRYKEDQIIKGRMFLLCYNNRVKIQNTVEVLKDVDFEMIQPYLQKMNQMKDGEYFHYFTRDRDYTIVKIGEDVG